MTTIVGIFDNTHDLDKAVGRLARAGFEDTVYDEAIVAGEALNVGPPVFAPGSAPVVVWGSPEPVLPHKPGHHAIARAFKAHLAHYHLPDQMIDAYATTFFTTVSSFWPEPTTSAPSKSWRSCESAALRG